MPRKTGTDVSTFPEPEISDVHVVDEAGGNTVKNIIQLGDAFEEHVEELRTIRRGHEKYLWEEEVSPIE